MNPLRCMRFPIVGALAVVLCAACAPTEPGDEPTLPAESPPTAEEVKEETAEAVETTTAFVKAERDKYIESVRESLRQLEDQIADVSNQIQSESVEMRAEAGKKLDELRARRNELNSKLAEFTEDSGQAWQEFKTGIDQAVSDLKAAVARAEQAYVDGDASEAPNAPELEQTSESSAGA